MTEEDDDYSCIIIAQGQLVQIAPKQCLYIRGENVNTNPEKLLVKSKIDNEHGSSNNKATEPSCVVRNDV